MSPSARLKASIAALNAVMQKPEIPKSVFTSLNDIAKELNDTLNALENPPDPFKPKLAPTLPIGSR